MVLVKHVIRDDFKVDRTKYIGVLQFLSKREAIVWAKKRFVKDTFLIVYYESSEFYHIYAERPEVEYWLQTTDEQICGTCHYWEERNYLSGERIQVCNLDHRGISAGRSCDMHLPIAEHGPWEE